MNHCQAPYKFLMSYVLLGRKQGCGAEAMLFSLPDFDTSDLLCTIILEFKEV